MFFLLKTKEIVNFVVVRNLAAAAAAQQIGRNRSNSKEMGKEGEEVNREEEVEAEEKEINNKSNSNTLVKNFMNFTRKSHEFFAHDFSDNHAKSTINARPPIQAKSRIEIHERHRRCSGTCSAGCCCHPN
jgi:hypothetical protein